MLWHIKISHYNEKARWALDRKRLPHLRRAPQPGLHPFQAARLTRGRTLPILVLDGRAIGDSTRIIAALEQKRPEPHLYPAHSDARRRALELEEFFDEELGPHIRRLAFHHLMQEPDRVFEVVADDAGPRRRAVLRAAFPVIRPAMARTYGVDAAGAEAGLAKTRAALDRIESERRGSDYLVGDELSVADLTAAALMAPLVRPPEFPYPLPSPPASLEEVRRDAILAHPGAEWVRGTYARHRDGSAEIAG